MSSSLEKCIQELDCILCKEDVRSYIENKKNLSPYILTYMIRLYKYHLKSTSLNDFIGILERLQSLELEGEIAVTLINPGIVQTILVHDFKHRRNIRNFSILELEREADNNYSAIFQNKRMRCNNYKDFQLYEEEQRKVEAEKTSMRQERRVLLNKYEDELAFKFDNLLNSIIELPSP